MIRRSPAGRPEPALPAPGPDLEWPVGSHPADVVVAAVLAVPGVATMHAGMFGEVATYLPGRRVSGVQLHDDATHVHVAVLWGYDIARTADLIKAAVGPIVGNRVDVTVQDLVEPAQSE